MLKNARCGSGRQRNLENAKKHWTCTVDDFSYCYEEMGSDDRLKARPIERAKEYTMGKLLIIDTAQYDESPCE